MGIDRFEDGGEDPSQKADTGPRHDTVRSGDTGPPGEVPQSGDARRPGDLTPDHPPRESPETTDTETKRAEPRTRNEYADHVAPPGRPPIEDDPPNRETDEQEFGEAMPSGHRDTEKSHSVEEADSGLGPDRETSDDLEGEVDDAREPSAVDELDDVPPIEETDQDEGLNPKLQASPEPYDESPTEGRPTDTDPGTEIDEGTHPLTDQEWAEHLTEVRDGLDWARRHGLQTHQLYTIDPDKQEWSTERNRLQSELVNEMYGQSHDVPCDQQAIIAGGLGGAGKTTVLTEHANIDLSNYLVVNPDNIKEEMARRGMIPQINGLSPMESSDLAHEESSYIAKRLAMRALADGKNLIWDITMSSEDSTKERINNLRTSGYHHIEGIFVNIPIETSIRRIGARHREGNDQYRAGHGLGGRFVPEEVVRNQADPEWGSQNRRTYEQVKASLDAWSIYDNSLDGRPPTRVETSPGWHRKVVSRLED